jgi:DNA-binding Xre family transcriptional regulator
MPIRMAEFQTRIREFRQAKGMSTRELAEKLGTSQPNLTRMETGSQAVTVEWLHKIGYVLGVTPTAFIDHDGVYATVRGDIRPDRKEWPLFTAEQAYVVPVPTLFGMPVNGSRVDAFEIGERDLIFCGRAQHFAEDTTGKRHVLHIRDDSGEGLCLATFEDNRFGPGFRPTQGHMPAPWLNLWDERIQRKWRVIAEFRGE